ncbi:MAG TPA: DUF1566 domain-containing protein [Candidatus Limnocylindrales bacterium]|nr:DUF1566 domain-containing protein [Candidatus Limnocylindrales bacterium]
MRKTIPVCLFVLALSCPATAGELTPSQDCEAARHKLVGRLAACFEKAQRNFVRGGSTDTNRLDDDEFQCVRRYSSSWLDDETRAAADGDSCPTAARWEIKDFVGVCMGAVDAALHGDALPPDVATCNAGFSDCNSSLATCLSACEPGPRPPLQTGQSICLDTMGITIPCSGTGQDGELQKGAARSFVDNGDGTISDNATGLMWEKFSSDGSIHDQENVYSWSDAFDVKIAGLNAMNFAGHGDWRMPNAFELESQMEYTPDDFSPSSDPTYGPGPYAVFRSPCTPDCSVLTCSCLISRAANWSSTTDWKDTTSALAMFVPSGAFFPSDKNSSMQVRAVRSGS